MQQGDTMQTGPISGRLQLIGALPTIVSTMRKLNPDEPRYVKPPRLYELPEYRKDMPYCRSKEPYLRPVRWCNPGDPNVVARAHALGAYELSYREYAEAAYWWMKKNMWWEMDGWYDAGETLRRGRGTCNHLNNAYMALCRCAGIKARILRFDMKFPPEQKERASVDPLVATFLTHTGGVLPESEVEVLIDGAWTPAYVVQNIFQTATTGWPISDFGESCLDLYYDAVPGSIHYEEDISLKTGMTQKLMATLTPATQERANLWFQGMQRMGKMVLGSTGGIEGYNRIARQKATTMSKEEANRQWSKEKRALIAQMQGNA